MSRVFVVRDACTAAVTSTRNNVFSDVMCVCETLDRYITLLVVVAAVPSKNTIMYYSSVTAEKISSL